MLAVGAFSLVGVCSISASGENSSGGLRGRVTDASDGILPGVTVVATSDDGRTLAAAVTDGAGVYVFQGLPTGVLGLTFQLEGFDAQTIRAVIEAGVESAVAVQRLRLAALRETVDVSAKAPVDQPRPLVITRPVPTHDRDSVCGPAKAESTQRSFGTIRSLRHETERGLYAKGDEVSIDGGTLSGLEVGQNLVARRFYRAAGPGDAAATGEHTSGLLQVVAADERFSVGIVVYACDELMQGDFLAAFKPEPFRIPDSTGVPAYEDAARILFADAGQILGAPRRLMVIDRGNDQGIRVGQRLTLFRRQGRGAPEPAVVGGAVVVAIRADSATIRVEEVTDVIASGDWAAPQRQSFEAQQAATPPGLPRP
jgi:hypothetical protein